MHTRQFLILVTFVVNTSLTQVLGQPLQLTPESFPCGDLNVTCNRWGYDACILQDREHYCLPCSHEYLRTLCSTKEEIPGCNLFCTEKALQKERVKLQSERSKLLEKCSMEKTFVQTNFSTKLKDHRELIEGFQKETIRQESRTKLLEDKLAKKMDYIKNQQDIITALSTVLGVFALLYVIFAGCMWCKYFRNKNKSTDSENPDTMCRLMSNDEVLIPMVKNQQDKSTLCVKDKSVQTDCYEDVLRQPERICQNDKKVLHNSSGDECPGNAKLKNIPPTDKDGSGKMAIQEYDHEFPSTTI